MILIGRNDADALATGWHPLQEGPAGVPCRWMSPRAVVRLAPVPGITGLCITVSAPAQMRGVRPGLSVYHGDKLWGHCEDLGEDGAWSTAIIEFDDDIELPAGATAAPLTLTLIIENRDDEPETLAFIPHEVLANGDLRELGAQVSSIRWIC
jgi:hypothetical protein